MLKIGLTGGIGSGKSTVAARLSELGAVVIDADAIAREVVSIGTPGLARVVDRFSSSVLAPDGSLDRPKLGRLVFAGDSGAATALADLNAIVHPLVAARTAELIAEVDPSGVVVYDVPLLVETGRGEGFDVVLVVEAPVELRLERLAGRGLAREEALSRMARQATDAERRAVATEVLDNSGSVAHLWQQVDRAWAEIIRPGSELG
ncbi:MAG: dephospho-CoA kinase [Frankiales bacterium]|nr:dephospho-CoA kinase [Frankiales bacterium]